MLDKLVESKINKKDKKKLRGLLFATSTLTLSAFIFALTFSLFSQNLVLGAENINLTSLITPPRIVENKPTPPEPKRKIKKPVKNDTKANVPQRKHNILRLDESPQKTPDSISSKPINSKERPNSVFEVGVLDIDPAETTSSKYGKDNYSNNGEIKTFVVPKPKVIKKPKEKIKKTKKRTPPPPPPPVKKPKKNVIVSLGVINGKAKNLVKPIFPLAAKSIGLRGKVTVQVLISENGKVISANVTNGHSLLRQNALKAALKSSFTPTYLSKEKVKVRGVIVYNFK